MTQYNDYVLSRFFLNEGHVKTSTLMDKLIKILSTSKGEKLPVESFEDKISFLKEKKKSPTAKKNS